MRHYCAPSWSNVGITRKIWDLKQRLSARRGEPGDLCDSYNPSVGAACQPMRQPHLYLTADHQMITSNTKCLCLMRLTNWRWILTLGGRQRDDKQEMPDRLVPCYAAGMAVKYGTDVKTCGLKLIDTWQHTPLHTLTVICLCTKFF